MRMFPHTITIITKTSNNYATEVINGVYWYGSNHRSVQGESLDNRSSINVIIPYANKPQTLKRGSLIVKGDLSNETITSIADLEQYMQEGVCITVQSIQDDNAGSMVDNIHVYGV